MAIGIDIGSNSLRVVKIECSSLEKIATYEKVVRTAENLLATKEISIQAAKRIIEALQEAKRRIDFHDDIMAVATAAFRKAHNAKKIAKMIEDATHISIEIVDAAREAFLSAKGVEYGLKRRGYDTQKFLMADVGGGSTEIVMKSKNALLFESFPVGILTTIQKYKNPQDMVFGIKKEMRPVREYLEDLFQTVGKPKIFVGTGGTPTTIAALKMGLTYDTYDEDLVSGSKITMQDVQKAYTKLKAMPTTLRAKLVGVGREDAIMAGVLILQELLNISKYKEMVVSDEGVREGAALLLCEKR